ncbi:hypothetical protein H257_17383 [Aphanomyces astaci]|uniref:Uncharacterized protein n=1 Tax=Aphanomyces astaci TaxID=112090 RepID=W4FH22_APHAT|nr:hypothetical protein H257_17383 [Aphanomyces astaci]ETV66043.1 hypothetical protein H257_17383 [Aphanomyces astaci]|eukprot:XP_009844472.1 hypothetical protein H257_17383 [Aphanomyces astaci]
MRCIGLFNLAARRLAWQTEDGLDAAHSIPASKYALDTWRERVMREPPVMSTALLAARTITASPVVTLAVVRASGVRAGDLEVFARLSTVVDGVGATITSVVLVKLDSAK